MIERNPGFQHGTKRLKNNARLAQSGKCEQHPAVSSNLARHQDFATNEHKTKQTPQSSRKNM